MGLAVINLFSGELCISLLPMCLSWPAVNYSDAEKINHTGLMSTAEKASDGVLGAHSPLQCEQRGSSDPSWGRGLGTCSSGKTLLLILARGERRC